MKLLIKPKNTLRRTFLKVAAATGALFGLGTAVTAQEGPITAEEIVLGGRRTGWRGGSPESIQSARNPTLRLIEGQEYTLTWENLDGAPHNFNIIDEEGEEQFVETEIVSSRGEIQTVEFTAQAGMAEYFCAPHPVAMRGEIEVVEGDDEEQAEETTDGEAVETIVDIPGEATPENLAIDADGSLYFGITAGEVRALTPEQTQETGLSLDDTQLVGELPGEAFGVEVVPDGTLYVALHTGEETGIWRLPRDGTAADGDMADDEGGNTDEPDDGEETRAGNETDTGDTDTVDGTDATDAEPFATVGVQDEVFPNGVEYDRRRDRLLFTESFGGVVYEAPLDADDPQNAASVWFEDDRLETETFGANGLTLGPDGNLFVAVTEDQVDGEDAGRVLRIPVNEDGSAGEAETYVEGPEMHGADGIDMHPLDRTLYVAAIFQSKVVTVTPEMETEDVLTSDDGLVFPSDVTFGTIPGQCNDLFICNFAPEDPEESAILRWSP